MKLHIFKRESQPAILGLATSTPWLGAVVWCGLTVGYRSTVAAASGMHTCDDCEKAIDAPIAPAAMAHYLAACAAARVYPYSPARQIRNLIARVETMAIPDAARFLRMWTIEESIDRRETRA